MRRELGRVHRIRLLGERIRDNRLRRLGHAFESLAAGQPPRHLLGMYVVTEADAAAIREIYEADDKLLVAIDKFPGIADNAKAREQARRIAGWLPLPAQPGAGS